MRTSVDVHNFLVERDVPHEVFLTTGRLRTPERLAAVLDLPESEVGRVLVFETRSRPVAAVLPLGADPDLRAIRRAARVSSLRLATEERSSELTGYLFESIPPAGLPSFRVVVDRALDRDAVLYFPGGEVRSVLKIRGTDLVKATKAVVAPIALPAPRERAAL